MDGLIEQFFNITVMQQSLPYLLKGLLFTVVLTLILVPVGLGIGLCLALASNNKNTLIRLAVKCWVSAFRAIPPAVLIILVFSTVSFLHLGISALFCVILALAMNNSAYFCEIYRAGLDSVPKGQAEAACSTGMDRMQVLFFVVLPQATRNVLPDLISNSIEVMKSTSLAAIISVTDLLYAANTVRAVTYNTSPLTLAALLYLIVLLPAVRLSNRMERSKH